MPFKQAVVRPMLHIQKSCEGEKEGKVENWGGFLTYALMDYTPSNLSLQRKDGRGWVDGRRARVQVAG
jgi:hypothetical protein